MARDQTSGAVGLWIPTTPGDGGPRAEWDRAAGPILDSLQRDADQIAAETASRIFRQYPAYARVREGRLLFSARENVRLALAVIRERRRASAEEVEERATVGGERARQRVPVDQVLSAFGLTMGVLRDHLLALGRANSVSPPALLEATQLVWLLAEDLTAAIAIDHHNTELRIARQDEYQRAEFLRQLLGGSISAADLYHHAPTYCLDESAAYHALRGRPAPDGNLDDLLRAVEADVRSRGGSAMAGTLEGDAVGIVSRVPRLEATGATVGVGGAADLAALERSYATASRVLEVAQRFQMTGVLTLADVSLRAAVVRETELGDLLLARHLGPLDVDAGFAAVIRDTLRVFLANGLQIKRTAQALGVHPNTLRYRLARYEELTGSDLSDARVLLELWWALERQRATAPA